MALILAFVVAVIATPLAARVANRLGFVDEPGPLKVQHRAVPYFGGVAVLAAIVAPVAGARASLLVPLAFACALGLADDRADLAPWFRLLAEAAIGAGAAWVAAPHDAGHVALGIVTAIVLINAVNLLDGLDGLAAGVVVMSALGFFVVLSGSPATLALALAGALLGFLVWNKPPARVYLGDAGSYLLGTALAMLLLAGSQGDAAVVAGALLFAGVPVADTAIAVIRRFRTGQPLFRGDRGHVYDQLVDRGWSAPAAVAACVVAQAAFTGGGIGIAQLAGTTAAVVTALTVLTVGVVAIAVFASPRSS